MFSRTLSVALVVCASAFAGDFGLKFEGGAAIPLSEPQSSRFTPGGTLQVKALFGVTSFFDSGPSVQLLMLPSEPAGGVPGSLWGFGGGVRFKRPHDATSLWGLSPWVDANALYILTAYDEAAGRSLCAVAVAATWAGRR